MSRKQVPPKPQFFIGSRINEALGLGEKRLAQLDYLKRMSPDCLEILVSWGEILPNGRGKADSKAMSDLDRTVDELLERGIEARFDLSTPMLPEELSDKGSWANRDAIYWFSDYARILAGKFGDRVTHWTSFVDPESCLPEKAKAKWASRHHRLLASAYGKEAMLAEREAIQLGFGLKFLPYFPASDRNRDHEAVLQVLAEKQDYYLTLLFKGVYDEAAISLAKYYCQGDIDFLRESDKHKIKDSIDFLRLDYEFHPLIDVKDPESLTRKAKLARQVAGKGEPYDHRRSSERLYEALKRLKNSYEVKDIHLSSSPYLNISEVEYETGVDDRERSLYHSYHLQTVAEFQDKDCVISSYLFPTPFDNAQAKDGMIRIADDDSLQMKDSAYWFRALVDTRNPHWEASVRYKEMEG